MLTMIRELFTWWNRQTLGTRINYTGKKYLEFSNIIDVNKNLVINEPVKIQPGTVFLLNDNLVPGYGTTTTYLMDGILLKISSILVKTLISFPL